jgi:hypothetical protein
MNIFRP